MNDEVKRFLDSIDYQDEDDLSSLDILKVLLHKDDLLYEVILHSKSPLPKESADNIIKASSNKINKKYKCIIKFNYDEINEQDIANYFKGIISDVCLKKPSLGFLKEEEIIINDEVITLEVGNKAEELVLKKEINNIKKMFIRYGLNEYEFNILLNEEKRKEVIEQIENDKITVKQEIKKDDSKLIFGKSLDNDLVEIQNIVGEQRRIVVEAYVFGIEGMEREKINIITLKISDKTNSIIGKIFQRDHDEYLRIFKRIKENNWYRFSGNVEYDNYAKDFVLSITGLEVIDSKDEKVVDDAEVKRVELHMHTMMSAMDGVIPADSLVSKIASMGMKAFAVTDHNCVQSFPDLFHGIEKYNKGKVGNDRFKVLYGTEINVIPDEVDIVFNNKDYNLLEQEYVVFDTETTGFYAGSDQMIEIGAVKIKNGNIIDRFDELINPHRPLPTKITELTFITDEMLQDKDDEVNVTKRFKEWIKDLPMVAHNAKFDISFMKAAYQKYDLGEFSNTVIDTMSMARLLHPEWPNHKLQTLTKNLDVPWDEDKHHRADYDAEGTAIAFYKMSKTLFDQNINTTTELIDDVDIDSMIKFTRPFHATIIARDRKGLKNLFKIISLANTKYLLKNSEPKIPRKDIIKLREGLLIGSSCVNGEIFDKAFSKEDEEVVNMMNFYDYIEVQPSSCFTQLIGDGKKFTNKEVADKYLERLVMLGKSAGKIVVATGDVHNLRKEDLIYRKIIINQKFNGKLHPLNRPGIEIPNMYLRTTKEMLDEFSFLDEELRNEIVVTNTNKIADMCEEIEVIIDTGGIPFAPVIENSKITVTNLVYNKAKEWYGDPLPEMIEERIALELYGAPLIDAVKKNTKDDVYKRLHEVILAGPERVEEEIYLSLKNDNPDNLSDEELKKNAKGKMTAIIGANFDVIYLIAQKLVKHSNDEGFLVGSRGSVGSSIVANLMGITEVNSLPPHYRCPNCKYSEFNNDFDEPYGDQYKCGFDLPDKNCPKCNTLMHKDGHDIPFQTFLGFNADKVPDIDLNFSDLNQASAHEYTKVLFGVDNVYRAGTIGTVAEKTAYGYVKGYCENNNILMRNIETERLAIGCTGVKRTTGQHPGGIVVIPGYMDVYDFTPFQFPAEDPTSAWRTTHFDYHAIDQDVLKLDILGHTDPTQLRMIQDLTGDDITKVPLDDKDTMSIFTSTKALGVTKEQIMCDTGTLGVPEFGTPFTIGLVKDTKPTTFAELVKIAGLAHGTDVWLGNAQELIQNNVVPFSKVIGCRDDIMVELLYQGLPPIKAFKIMEFVRKGKASKDPETWAEYKKLMQEYKIDDWFINSCQKIKYMFPKAHAAAYVTSAFRIAWYKVHKPIIYYTSYFSTRFEDFDINVMVKGYDAIKEKMIEIQSKGYDATNKEQSLLETLKLALEATARGFKFKMIDIEKSDGVNFVIDGEDSMIMPFRSLDGLGDSVAKQIIKERNIKPFYSIEDFASRGKVNQTTVDKMRLMGVFDGMSETSQLSLF